MTTLDNLERNLHNFDTRKEYGTSLLFSHGSKFEENALSS